MKMKSRELCRTLMLGSKKGSSYLQMLRQCLWLKSLSPSVCWLTRAALTNGQNLECLQRTEMRSLTSLKPRRPKPGCEQEHVLSEDSRPELAGLFPTCGGG